jgi:cation diffusion facilitator CzcD-associated flavoprotein CzcO
MPQTDVAIIGAGPYGLSAAAHLRAVDGVNVQVFGRPMSFWADNMPAGMRLRSPWVASNLSDPGGRLTLDAFRAATDQQFSNPVPIESFVEYGRWFQKQVAPDLDPRCVKRVDRVPNGFRLTVEDGTTVSATRVVVAAGIESFPRWPEELKQLSPDLVSHSSKHSDLGRFAGQCVLVIGGGQSALESAALLHEAGAQAEVLMRMPVVRFLDGRKRRYLHKWPIEPLLYSWPDV